MLARHMLGYAPSLVVPALTAFGAIFAYTRLLTPAEYGHYALVLNAMTLLIAVFYFWIQTALPRLMPKAIKENTASSLQATTYVAFTVVSFVLLLAVGVFSLCAPSDEAKMVAWLAVPLAFTRAFLNMNQAFHRSYLNFSRYNLIECGQAVLGLVTGLGLVYFLELGNQGAIWGMTIGMMVMMLVDFRMILKSPLREFSKPMLIEIAQFGLPLVVTYGLGFIISSSDRFLIEYFRGPDEVGIYAAGYTVMDRVTTILFLMVSTASYPLTVHRLENEGPEGARDQIYKNGVAALALAIPACAGLILTNQQLAAVLIGPTFREGALTVMPWIAVSAIMNGLATHYFSHSIHIAKKSYLFLLTQGPSAILNLALNILLIPRFGYMGAVYAALASYGLQLLLTIGIGHRAFPIRFPYKPAFQILLAVAAMSGVLIVLDFPVNLLGLIGQTVLGGAVYGACLVAMDVMGARAMVGKRLKRS